MSQKIHLMSRATSLIISVLNTSVEQGIPAQVSAGKTGYSIRVSGRVIARGKTPEALVTAFQERQAKAFEEVTSRPRP